MIRSLSRILSLIGLIAPLVMVPLAASPAQAATDRDVTAAHRLEAEFWGSAYDDWDFGDPLTFTPPPAAREYTLNEIVDFSRLNPPIDYLYPGGDPGNGFVLTWGAGPFQDESGSYVRPTDGSVALCFYQQRLEVLLMPGNAVKIRALVGMVKGSPPCGGLLAKKPVALGYVSVTAPPNGTEVCSDFLRLEDSGDTTLAKLCLTNTRIDPRPIASTPSGTSGHAPYAVLLDASPSIVPEGVSSWHWNFGDGHTASTGPLAYRYYQNPGSYPVTLTITDVNGITRSAGVMTVVVHPPPTDPVADLAGGGTYPPGPVTFSAAGSTPGDGRTGVIFEYWWDFGDGTQIITRAPDDEWTHTYTQPGSYQVTLTIFTADMRTSTAYATVTIR